MDDKKEVRVNGWRSSLIYEASNLHDPENLKYLARKASVMVAKEQNELGNKEYKSIFSDPDNLSQDPGG